MRQRLKLLGCVSAVVVLSICFAQAKEIRPMSAEKAELQQRGAGLNDATAELDALQKSGLRGNESYQALASHLKENPVFSDAGVSETAVWGRFKDGPYMLIPTNIVPNTPPEPEDSLEKALKNLK